MHNAIDYLLIQLPILAPSLLVYLIGMVISLYYLPRYASTAGLVLFACGLLLLLSLIFLILPILQGFLFNTKVGNEWISYSWAISFAEEVIRAGAMLLLILAAFAWRSHTKIEFKLSRVQESLRQETLMPHRGRSILVSGLLGVLVLSPFGVLALIKGKRDLSAMLSGEMDSSGETMTTIGYVLGIFGTFILVLQFCAVLFWILLPASFPNLP